MCLTSTLSFSSYGLTTGSRLGIRLLQLFDAWQDQAKDVCPQASTAIDLWRLPLWIPVGLARSMSRKYQRTQTMRLTHCLVQMNISIMIGLRAYPWQWGFMSLTSFIGFCVSLLASQWFNFVSRERPFHCLPCAYLMCILRTLPQEWRPFPWLSLPICMLDGPTR